MKGTSQAQRRRGRRRWRRLRALDMEVAFVSLCFIDFMQWKGQASLSVTEQEEMQHKSPARLQPLSSGGHYLRTRGKTKGEVQDTTLFQTAKNACHRPQMSALVRQEGTLQTKQQMNLDSFLPTILRNSHSQHESSSSRFKHKPLISLGL